MDNSPFRPLVRSCCRGPRRPCSRSSMRSVDSCVATSRCTVSCVWSRLFVTSCAVLLALAPRRDLHHPCGPTSAQPASAARGRSEKESPTGADVDALVPTLGSPGPDLASSNLDPRSIRQTPALLVGSLSSPGPGPGCSSAGTLHHLRPFRPALSEPSAGHRPGRSPPMHRPAAADPGSRFGPVCGRVRQTGPPMRSGLPETIGLCASSSRGLRHHPRLSVPERRGPSVVFFGSRCVQLSARDGPALAEIRPAAGHLRSPGPATALL